MAHFDDTPRFASAQGIAFAVKDVWQQARLRMSGAIVQIQHARMMAVLSGMSDARLAVIGITRDEISEHAAYLVGLK